MQRIAASQEALFSLLERLAVVDAQDHGSKESNNPLLLLGGDRHQWRCKEVGDGNMNFVFIVEGPLGSLIAKQATRPPPRLQISAEILSFVVFAYEMEVWQAIPYVRCVGEQWPMSQKRAYYEWLALTEQFQHAPQFVPRVSDPNLALFFSVKLVPHTLFFFCRSTITVLSSTLL